MGATSANAQMEQVGEPLVLDGEWEFRSEGPNALVLSEWLSRPEKAGPDIADIAGNAARDDDTTGWRRMVPGAWSHQLEAEPDRYPVPVWYRTTFEAEHVPARMQLVVDGWAGSSYRAFVNGNEVLSIAERSPFDSQMKTLDMTDLIRAGTNVVAIRLVVEGPRDGLLDRLKVLGEFALASGPDGTYRVVEPRTAARPAPWTEQGYPFRSGLGCYRRTVTVPEEFDGCRLLLEIPIRDDVVEVVVGGDSVGVRMWDPYEVEVTGRLRPGENEVELRVANTAANLIGGVDRPSGLAGPPRLAAYRERPAREEDRA